VDGANGWSGMITAVATRSTTVMTEKTQNTELRVTEEGRSVTKEYTSALVSKVPLMMANTVWC